MRFLLSCFLFLALEVGAATTNHIALSTSRADVQAAHDLCMDGDTLTIPAGDSIWQSAVNITNAISIVGSGTNTTIIRDGNTNTAGASDIKCLLLVRTKAGGLYRVTGIQWGDSLFRSNPLTVGIVRVRGQSKIVRIDNCLFSEEGNAGVYINDGVCGVMDHCHFSYTTGDQHAIFVDHGTFDNLGGTFGDQAWITDWDLGGTNKWYIEDCTKGESVSNPSFIDSQRGGRWAMRHCTFGKGNHLVTHGAEVKGNRVRGTQTIEIYKNTINDGDPNAVGLVNLRSGAGVVWGNTMTSSGLAKSFLFLSAYRMAQSFFWGGLNGETVWDNPFNVPGGPLLTGTHNGASNVQYLEDTNAVLGVNQYYGYSIHNPSATTPTSTSDPDYDPIGHRYSMVNSNSATRMYYEDATQYQMMTFTNGNSFQLWHVTNGLDICGMRGCTVLNTTSTPKDLGFIAGGVWQWSNSWNGTTVTAAYGFKKDPVFVENYHYYHTGGGPPGYLPLVYPHPLVASTSDPPGAPNTPFPADLATGINPASVTLTWASTNTVYWDVFFDTSNPPTSTIASGLTTPNITIGPLANGVTYFWKVIANNASMTAGPVWRFTTSTPVSVGGAVVVTRRKLL